MADRTAERLDRILYILPRAIRSGGATLDELAEALDCGPADILADLEEVTARAYYHASGAADQLQILVDGNRVQVFAGREFGQPVRLSPRETMALELGLRTLASEAADHDRDRILALANRLEAELASEPADSGSASASTLAERRIVDDTAFTGPDDARPIEIDVGDDGFRGAIAQAAIDRRRCRIAYLRPGDDAPAERDVAPYVLVHSAGAWYILGHDADRDDIRVFRMDRIIRVEVGQATFAVPADFDATVFVGQAGVYRSSGRDIEVSVRYSPRVARWIAERMPVEPQPDGSVVARHLVGDPAWLVRHVLRYGEDARVIEPAAMREIVARTALRLIA